MNNSNDNYNEEVTNREDIANNTQSSLDDNATNSDFYINPLNSGTRDEPKDYNKDDDIGSPTALDNPSQKDDEFYDDEDM